ncbi:uncharacterized protein LOC134202447 [Armigeres subalbatus]|uniref:uncharacterized protein LOC134202447 n=1 Tax=Armigeres subalbatus TaxID=124917 RepID=UPI002ED61893
MEFDSRGNPLRIPAANIRRFQRVSFTDSDGKPRFLTNPSLILTGTGTMCVFCRKSYMGYGVISTSVSTGILHEFRQESSDSDGKHSMIPTEFFAETKIRRQSTESFAL